MAGCGGDDPPAPVAVETACTLGDGTRVIVEGFLRLPDSVRQSDRAVIDLFTRRGGGGDRVSVEFVLGNGPNQMERLPAAFSATSLRVRGDGGSVATLNDSVTIEASVSGPSTDCVLRDPKVTVAKRGAPSPS